MGNFFIKMAVQEALMATAGSLIGLLILSCVGYLALKYFTGKCLRLLKPTKKSRINGPQAPFNINIDVDKTTNYTTEPLYPPLPNTNEHATSAPSAPPPTYQDVELHNLQSHCVGMDSSPRESKEFTIPSTAYMVVNEALVKAPASGISQGERKLTDKCEKCSLSLLRDEMIQHLKTSVCKDSPEAKSQCLTLEK